MAKRRRSSSRKKSPLYFVLTTKSGVQPDIVAGTRRVSEGRRTGKAEIERGRATDFVVLRRYKPRGRPAMMLIAAHGSKYGNKDSEDFIERVLMGRRR